MSTGGKDAGTAKAPRKKIARNVRAGLQVNHEILFYESVFPATKHCF